MRTTFVILLAVMLGMLAASLAGAAIYDPNTTVIVYIHGFDSSGYLRVGEYGGDVYDSDMDAFAAMLGQPTSQTDPTAPNQIAATDYYGNTPPAWYTSQDIADDAAMPTCVPRYALRCAKFIKHVLERSGATGVAIVGASFGGEISRYLIEHDLCQLASTQKICKWAPVVGVVTGNWAATNVGDLAPIFGADSPDIDDMKYSWIDANISARLNMNSALYGPIVINQWSSTDDPDGYLSLLSNKPNDGVNLVADCLFAGYSTTAALHPATDGTLQMPGKSYHFTYHQGIADAMGARAGWAAMVKNNKRVTVTITRVKGNAGGNWVLCPTVWSPMANTLWAVTAPMTEIRKDTGVAPKTSLTANTYKTVNQVIFDQIVPPGETSLTVNVQGWILKWHPEFYNSYSLGSDVNKGIAAGTVSTTGNSTITISYGTNFTMDLATVVKNVY